MMTFKEFLQSRGFKRFVALAIIALLIYALQSMLNMILITFILTYLMNRLSSSITRRVSKVVRINNKVTVIFLYVVLVAGLFWGSYMYLPRLIQQLNELVQIIMTFYSKPFEPYDNPILNYMMESLRNIDVASYVDQGLNFLLKKISDIGKWGLNLLIAIIMSLFFSLQKEKVTAFTAKFKSSKIGFIYNEIEFFGRKFIHSFGKVIEVQFLIALLNSVFSVLFLWMLGFPSLFALGIMIFLLGLIPVMGVIVSLIPLCAIAFKIGGLLKVVYVLVMIALLHAFEAYVLNPKLMSNKTHLPIFYTFMVLIVGEHFFGVWGLILGIPIFMFLLDIIEVPILGDVKKRGRKAQTIENRK